MNIRKEIKNANIKNIFTQLKIIIAAIFMSVPIMLAFPLEDWIGVFKGRNIVLIISRIMLIMWVARCFFSVLCNLIVMFHNINIVLCPVKSRLFQCFESEDMILKVVSDIENKNLYDFNFLYINEKYVYHSKNIESLIKKEDITDITKVIHIQNGKTQYYEIEIRGKNAYNYSIEYSKYWENQLDTRMKIIGDITSLEIKEKKISHSNRHIT